MRKLAILLSVMAILVITGCEMDGPLGTSTVVPAVTDVVAKVVRSTLV